MKVLIVCVNYNSLHHLNRYLISLNSAVKECNVVDLKVVVVDNSSMKSDLETNHLLYSINYSFQGKNLGYLGAAKCGLREESDSLDLYDYVIISNVDLEVDLSFFVRLSKIKKDENVGCIAPCIYSKYEKADRNPKIINRPLRRQMNLLKMMYKYPLLHYLYTNSCYNFRRKKKQLFADNYIYAAHGSFLLFTNSFTSFLKSFEFPSFLFGEEIFFAENLRILFLKTLYCKSLVVYDSDHVSTSMLKRRTFYKWNYQSLLKIISIYFND